MMLKGARCYSSLFDVKTKKGGILHICDRHISVGKSTLSGLSVSQRSKSVMERKEYALQMDKMVNNGKLRLWYTECVKTSNNDMLCKALVNCLSTGINKVKDPNRLSVK